MVCCYFSFACFVPSKDKVVPKPPGETGSDLEAQLRLGFFVGGLKVSRSAKTGVAGETLARRLIGTG
nr:MAG TPA: hypothetical protein [Caudoviricetes sp.]